MEIITSRKNQHIQMFRALAAQRSARREQGLFVCDGEKLLGEALANEAELGEILVREGQTVPTVSGIPVYSVEESVFSYASPLENSPGPLFTVHIPAVRLPEALRKVILLENVQDPGNVGTVLRSAAALGVDCVILCGECADPYQPKVVRGTMGAIFRQNLWLTDIRTAAAQCRKWELPLYGAALTPSAVDVRSVPLRPAAVAVGNEGHGLSAEMLSLCDAQLIIPMTPGSESLNAAVAASLLMWEMSRNGEG